LVVLGASSDEVDGRDIRELGRPVVYQQVVEGDGTCEVFVLVL